MLLLLLLQHCSSNAQHPAPQQDNLGAVTKLLLVLLLQFVLNVLQLLQ